MSTEEPTKPSRKDLLSELEDIKSSLEREVFGDLLDATEDAADARSPAEPAGAPQTSERKTSDPEVPVLTESVLDLSSVTLDEGELPDEELSALSSTDDELKGDMAALLAEETKNDEPGKAKPSRSKPQTKSAETAGQQSLFEEPAASTPQPAKRPSKPVNRKPQPTQAVVNEQKTENPFLPAHIRERLNRNHEQSVIQDLVQVGDALARPDARPPKPLMANNLSDDENLLIDAVVAKYLPEIERELRRRLAEQLAKNPVTP
ncbi:hypothetical protein [Teredinibacter turnerae]|uniref:hypothetical protein n=1 Tax=Teredinibacter turnerae TaxID=2426 RepID=UPI0005F7BC24|nr:hypothetical protein [Teredinibacter turnerae]